MLKSSKIHYDFKGWFVVGAANVFYSPGGSESTAIKRRQQQLGRMSDFLPSVTFLVFYLKNYEAPHIKSQTMRHPLINLVNTTLSHKYGDP